MNKVFLLIMILVILTANPVAIATSFYFADGSYHIVNDTQYQNDYVVLDGNVTNNPGTHLELIDGGSIYFLVAHHNSTIAINGGSIEGRIELYDGSNATINNGLVSGVWTGQDSHLEIYNGTIPYGIESYYDSIVIISGGTIGKSVESNGDSTIEIHGGTITGNLNSSGNGTIYLYGSNFNVGGQNLGLGDSLRDFGIINSSYLTGTITGTLEDGSVLSSQFRILLNNLNPDIVIIPEPTTLLLLGMGTLLIKKRK